MRLHSFRIKNFRRLKDVFVDLENEVTILVGANNSGKTAATHAIQMFLSEESRSRFTIHDFHSDCWRQFDQVGSQEQATDLSKAFPHLSLDLWFDVTDSDLYLVMELLPRLPNPEEHVTKVGVRIEFAPQNADETFRRFQAERAKAAGRVSPHTTGAPYHPWPKSLMDYLSKQLSSEFGLHYLVLDPAHFDAEFKQDPTYEPTPLTLPDGRSGANVLKRLVRVDPLDAQRHLTDEAPTGRAEDLSKRLSRFYKRNLEKREDDLEALRALAQSEDQFNQHLARVFEPTLGELRGLGYPGLSDPRLIIKSALDPASVMNQSAKVHYAVAGAGVTDFTLPDKYNGLGFKNLIYMVVELLDHHRQWMETAQDRPPLHLVFIEEPESHMHAQLQQVFVKRVFDLLRPGPEDAADFTCQLIVTTHSPHIVFERGFKPIRYFRRSVSPSHGQISEVLNVSTFSTRISPEMGDFLQRYMKLAHCDLFFADAAIFVEGNAERLLMPLMIEKSAPGLQRAYLTTLEVGGAFMHKFRELVQFLGINTLVITDIDSVSLPSGSRENGADEDDETGVACMVGDQGAVTSNECLKRWLPGKTTIADLLAATEAEKTQSPPISTRQSKFAIRTVNPFRGALKPPSFAAAPSRKTLRLRTSTGARRPRGGILGFES